jgi:hypothetical protein
VGPSSSNRSHGGPTRSAGVRRALRPTSTEPSARDAPGAFPCGGFSPARACGPTSHTGSAASGTSPADRTSAPRIADLNHDGVGVPMRSPFSGRVGCAWTTLAEWSGMNRRSAHRLAWADTSLPGQIFAPPTAGEHALRASPVRTVTRRGIPSLPATRWSTALVSTPARPRQLRLTVRHGASCSLVDDGHRRSSGDYHRRSRRMGYAPGLGWRPAAAVDVLLLTWVDTRNRDADQTAALAARDDPSPTANRPSHFHCEWGRVWSPWLTCSYRPTRRTRDAGAAGRGWRSPVWRSRRH